MAKQKQATSDRTNTEAQGATGTENRQNPKSMNPGGFEQDLAQPNASTDVRVNNYYNRAIDRSGEAKAIANVITAGGNLVHKYLESNSGDISDYKRDLDELKGLRREGKIDDATFYNAMREARHNALMGYEGKSLENVHKLHMYMKSDGDETWDELNYANDITKKFKQLFPDQELDPDDTLMWKAAEKMVQEKEAKIATLKNMTIENKIAKEQGTYDWNTNGLPEFKKMTEIISADIANHLNVLSIQSSRGKRMTGDQILAIADKMAADVSTVSAKYSDHADDKNVKNWISQNMKMVDYVRKIANQADKMSSKDRDFAFKALKALNSGNVKPEQMEALEKLGPLDGGVAGAKLLDGIAKGGDITAAAKQAYHEGAGSAQSQLAVAALLNQYQSPDFFTAISDFGKDEQSLLKVFKESGPTVRREFQKAVDNWVGRNFAGVYQHCGKRAASVSIGDPRAIPIWAIASNGAIGINTELNGQQRMYAEYAYATVRGAILAKAASSGMTWSQYTKAAKISWENILSHVGGFKGRVK